MLPLPFAGYWLMREVYQYNQQMGITLMGGFLSWLFILQAILIGILFLGANYYFWLGIMYRIPGSEAKYRKPIMTMLVILLVRSEEHTSELQSQSNLVCRLLLE